MKKIWRYNGEIPNCDFILPVESNDYCFLYGEKKFLGGNNLTRTIWYIENLLLRFYLEKTELRKSINAILRKIINDPDFVDKIHRKTIKLNNDYFAFAEKIRKMDLAGLGNRKLLSLRDKLYLLQALSHGESIATTWLVDCDGEDFSKYLTSLIDRQIKAKGLNLLAVECFSILTTPISQSFAIKQDLEFFRLLAIIDKDKKIKKMFQTLATAELVKEFGRFPKKIKNIFLSHLYKFLWIPYGYIGPAYSMDYYLELARGLIHERVNPKVEIAKIKNKTKKIKAEKSKIFGQLSLTSPERRLLNIAADIVWLKGYRKDCYFHGFFVMDMILAEVAKRVGLSLLQAKYLTNKELDMTLLSGKDFSDLANQRMKFSVIKRIGNKTTIKSGRAAEQLMRKENFEKIVIDYKKELKGTCACAGKAQGKVKIVNLPQDMEKMEFGDIMLSHTTYPALVPAMKKAAAIITEDGGITCHAAIVARELQTPCIVGAKNILQVLKDGDKVEIDANKGIIKKI